MDSLEVAAKTVEEAIDLALKELGVGRDEIDVVVVTKGKSGILGIGSEPARIRVALIGAIPEAAALAKEIIEELLGRMGVSASVHLKRQEEEQDPDSPLSLEVSGDDSGLLIGRGGATLSALQFIVSFLLSRGLKSWAVVNVDVEGYRRRRNQSLRALAFRLAERVTNSGRPFTLEPMSASERRIIHLALAESEDVTTESTGQGEGRRVCVKPKTGW